MKKKLVGSMGALLLGLILVFFVRGKISVFIARTMEP